MKVRNLKKANHSSAKKETVTKNHFRPKEESPNFSKILSIEGDQDGGSGGHLLGRRQEQVREKATGDLLPF